MDKQEGHTLPSSYIYEPSCEIEALQFFLHFFPYKMLPDWACEITKRGGSKYNKPRDTFLSYDPEHAPSMLLRVFGCFLYMLLYPGHRGKSFWQVIDVDNDPLAV